MEICIVINLFNQPFRSSDMAYEAGDVERVNKRGKKLLFVLNAANGDVQNILLWTFPELSRKHFDGIYRMDDDGKQIRVRPESDFELMSAMGLADGVKIIIAGHGEKGVPFVTSDGGYAVDTWLLLKGLLEFLTRGFGGGGLGLCHGNRSGLRICFPCCYAAHGDFEPGNDSICYEMARYFTYAPIAAKVREITNGLVFIVGAKNVVYGIASRGYPERTDALQQEIDRRLLNASSARLPFDVLSRGGTYKGNTAAHGSKSFRSNQKAIDLRQSIRDAAAQNLKTDEKEFGKGKGNKMVLGIKYLPAICATPVAFQMKMVHKYTKKIVMPTTKIIFLDEGRDLSFQRYVPGHRRATPIEQKAQESTTSTTSSPPLASSSSSSTSSPTPSSSSSSISSTDERKS